MKQKSKQSARTLVIRLLCVLLCVLVTAGVLAGCRKKPDNGKPSGTTAAPANDSDAASDTEPADGRDDLDDSYHFDRDFRILSRESTADEFESSSSIGANTVSNAVFSRNALVEKRADVTIRVIPLDGDWEGAKDGDSRGGNKEFEGRVRNDANADKSEYDLIATHSAYLANLAVDGLGMDLTQLEDINLTKRWWNEAYETVLTYQSFNNAKCIEMLEMIRVSANISFQQVFTNCLGNPNSLVPVAIRETREISNIYASDHTKWDIAKLYKDLEAIKKN